VGTFEEIDFYDDSISTTPESTIAGIRAIGNVDTIILGGVDRGYDFKALEAELRTSGVRNIVLFPESGEHMLGSEEGFRVLHTSSMDEAVQFAYAHTEKGKSCLLSPSAPSYNLFTNFEARGAAFSDAVKKYGNA
jgi:UDP-N-acetylmuramoyl-L-alanine---L-glutamate ligase